MKSHLIIGLIILAGALKAEPPVEQPIKDPLFDYCKEMLPVGTNRLQLSDTKLNVKTNTNTDTNLDDDDGSYTFTSATKFYYFQADFTGNGIKSIFITDDGEQLDNRGGYSWSIYYPAAAGSYIKITRETTGAPISFGRSGPYYIGYISQINRYGFISGDRRFVAAYFLNNGSLVGKQIGTDPEGFMMDNPKYFPENKAQNYHIINYTLAQLTQKYPTHSPRNVKKP